MKKQKYKVNRYEFVIKEFINNGNEIYEQIMMENDIFNICSSNMKTVTFEMFKKIKIKKCKDCKKNQLS